MGALRNLLAVFLALAICSGAAFGATEPRVALVIGNSAYTGSLGNLANPANDARLMAGTLRKLGFEVIELEDADLKKMQRAVIEFGDALAKAGSEATGLFYYAGHGLQVDGENYLIPVSAEITNEREVEVEAVANDLVLRQMDFAGNAVNIVILDACRNNPLSRGFRSQVSGLAEQKRKPRGTFIAYSTAPGDVAADGNAANSPYTRAVVDAIQKPGAALEEVFRDVRSRVMAATNQKQVPWDSSSLTASFYFVPPNQTAAAEPPPAIPATPAAGGEATAVELAYWNSIAGSSNPAMFQNYLKKYPDGAFVDIAAAKLDELSSSGKSRSPEPAPDAAPELTSLDATYVAIQGANVRAGPSTDSKIVARLKADDPVQATGQTKARDWYRVEFEGGSGFVNATLLAPADANEIAEWRDLKAAPDAEAAKAFLVKHPGGYFKPKAEALLAALQAPAPAPAPAPAAAPAPEPAVAAPAAAQAMTPGQTFRDCGECPEMVVVPSGSFIMGAAEGETGQYRNESPQHAVTIARSFAVAKFETTAEQYAVFIQRTGHDGGNSCNIGGTVPTPDMNWKNPRYAGYTPTKQDPVVCVSWNDAKAYVEWLSRLTGKRYRLLTEAEWEYAARAGTTTMFPWGADQNAACGAANVADQTTAQASWWKSDYLAVACNDGALYTTPGGRYSANAFGLYDMIGNVNEWVADCYVDGYAAAPADGSPVEVTGCQQRAARGGSWANAGYQFRSAYRSFGPPTVRIDGTGLRVAREL